MWYVTLKPLVVINLVCCVTWVPELVSLDMLCHLGPKIGLQHSSMGIQVTQHGTPSSSNVTCHVGIFGFGNLTLNDFEWIDKVRKIVYPAL